MRLEHSVSRRLIMIVSLHVIMILINGYFVFSTQMLLKDDARLINEAGLLRGNVQRVSKLAIAGMDASAEVETVDKGLHLFMADASHKVRGVEVEFRAALLELHDCWEELKVLLAQGLDGAQQRDELVRVSEGCWLVADRAVTLAQQSSEMKLSVFLNVALVLAFDLMLVVAIMRLISREVKDTLEVQASRDALTGAFNRHVFDQQLEVSVAFAQRQGGALSLIVFDLDHFKAINDAHGHSVGDGVLVRTSEVVRGEVRLSDTFCRIGGEEFAVIAQGSHGKQGAELAERLRMRMQEAELTPGVKVTASFGVATLKQHDSPMTLLSRADALMYEAKARGRNTVVSDEGG